MKKLASFILPLVALALFAWAFNTLRAQLHDYTWDDILTDLVTLPHWQIALAFFVTFLSYATLAGYDALALNYANQSLPFMQRFFVGCIGFAFSNNLGAPMVTGGLLRFRLYKACGLKGVDIAKIVVYISLAFWIGVFAGGGFYLTLQPNLASNLKHHVVATRYLGMLFLLACAALLFICSREGRLVKLWKWTFKLPSRSLAWKQLALGLIDWTLAGSVLYCLLPRPHVVPFTFFIGGFILTQVASFLSHVPGGIGILETSVLAILKPYFPASQLIGVLLAYRAIYYFIPLIGASIGLSIYELLRLQKKWKQHKSI